jgi:hypothetical protein
MITLKNDSLCFSFPEIDEVIRRLIEQHVNSTLPAIIAADRARAVGRSDRFGDFVEQRRKNAGEPKAN